MWAWEDLNLRPHAYQACALTNLSYKPPFGQAAAAGGGRRLRRVRYPPGTQSTIIKKVQIRLFATSKQRSAVTLNHKLRLLSLKGGDPAAPSGTATLLRLSASY